jgi:hypothetical protein
MMIVRENTSLKDERGDVAVRKRKRWGVMWIKIGGKRVQRDVIIDIGQVSNLYF